MSYKVPPLPKDKVQSFGYKCAWIAVRTTDMGAVIDTLGLREPHPCSWADGISQAYKSDSGHVFVTPSLRGYVLCVSCSLPEFPTGVRPDEITPILERLAKRFDDVQYYFTYRVVDAHAWARFMDGKRIRAFAVADGERSWDIGPRTEAEAKLNLEEPFPTESEVMKVAGQWSINPTDLESMDLEVTQGVDGLL
jgi:hypothetical protein